MSEELSVPSSLAMSIVTKLRVIVPLRHSLSFFAYGVSQSKIGYFLCYVVQKSQSAIYPDWPGVVMCFSKKNKTFIYVEGKRREKTFGEKEIFTIFATPKQNGQSSRSVGSRAHSLTG